ncbi:hypothetical protein [Streptomyces profundus]|uniref:hypothetical protein n=1 Tax=Streptomyces profundus TaxID=2867410 RepID=UPI001D164925|nr:hypothetical protein [Streptomyces sp. MA3_2.13]UED86613.1 hypothetical protein K4G22_22445 [Streptomyces sp. MA3_2.13]
MAQGESLGERHRLIRAVGSGGMGVGHEAWDELLDRRAAANRLHRSVAEGSVDEGRFRYETRASISRRSAGSSRPSRGRPRARWSSAWPRGSAPCAAPACRTGTSNSPTCGSRWSAAWCRGASGSPGSSTFAPRLELSEPLADSGRAREAVEVLERAFHQTRETTGPEAVQVCRRLAEPLQGSGSHVQACEVLIHALDLVDSRSSPPG